MSQSRARDTGILVGLAVVVAIAWLWWPLANLAHVRSDRARAKRALEKISTGPGWERCIEGRVVDAETGAPIPGAIVAATPPIRIFLGAVLPADRWTRTDADGRFVVPGRFALSYYVGGFAMAHSEIDVFHPDFGAHAEEFRPGSRVPFPGWDRVVIRMRRNPWHVENTWRREKAREICVGFGGPPCREACRIVYGDDRRCTFDPYGREGS